MKINVYSLSKFLLGKYQNGGLEVWWEGHCAGESWRIREGSMDLTLKTGHDII